MAHPLQQLSLLCKLPFNWDGYGADTPDAHTVQLAAEFAEVLLAFRKPADPEKWLFVNPTRNGGVLLEWESRELEFELAIEPNGIIGFLQMNKLTKEIKSKEFSLVKDSIAIGLLHDIRCSVAA